MTFETIDLTVENSLAVITFNRPQSYNALNDKMAAELFAATVEIQEDPSVRAVLLTGAGAAFHAGGDIKAFVAEGDAIPGYIDRTANALHAFISHLVRMPKPVVSAVNGPAAGAGMSIALAGDLLVAREDALFTCAYSKIAASPDGSMSYFLVRLIGMRRAMELYLTNRTLTAQEAMEWGLVNRVLPVENFLEEAKAIARELAQGPTLAYGRAKDLFYHSLNHQLETQMELESRGIVASTRSEDFREGTRAFLEKRPPTFHGR